MIYLDNAATTKVNSDAAAEVGRVLCEAYANPSSLYSAGVEARKVIDRARETLAGIAGCAAEELYFTSGGTEGNNLAILGAARARKNWGDRVVVTGFEHPSVQNTVASLEDEGFTVVTVMPGRDGKIDPEEFLRAVDKRTVLCAAMRVNNETGALTDTPALAAEVKRISRRTAFHCDCVQGFLKHPTALDGAIDTMAVSAHKIHGPRGTGFLYVRKGFNMATVLHGGGQERGLRSGTENTALIAGFAKAAEAASDWKKDLAAVTLLRDELRRFVSGMPEAVIHSPADASPYIFNFSLPGYRSETLLHFFEERGILVSSGSACGRGERSHTLSAMGLEDRLTDSAVRVSFSNDNTMDDVLCFERALSEVPSVLRKKD